MSRFERGGVAAARPPRDNRGSAASGHARLPYVRISVEFVREFLLDFPVLVFGQVAQLVEQRTENPRVGSSILPLATFPGS